MTGKGLKGWLYFFHLHMLLTGAIITSYRQKKTGRAPYKWPTIEPPVATVKPYTRILHGDTVIDNYYWLSDYFRKGPDMANVLQYLEAENAYTEAMMKGTEPLQTRLFEEMKGRIKEQDESVPYFRNGYYYYTRTEEGKQYYKYCRKKGLDAPEEVLLDVDTLAQGHTYYAVTGFNVSPDNKLLAYGVDTVSRRQYTIHIKNLETGELLSDTMHGTTGGSVWANDNQTLFYVKNNPVTLLTEKIMRHTLGDRSGADETVYHEPDNTNYIDVSKAKSGAFIYIYSGGTLSSETWYLDAGKPTGAFQVFQPRIRNVLYSVTALDDRFLVLTNHGAVNFRLMECPLDRTYAEHWTEVIPHRADVLLEDVDEFKNFLVISERKEGLIQLAVHNLADRTVHYVDFGEEAYTAYPANNPEYETTNLRYAYTSLTTPASTYDYDMQSRRKTLMKQQEVVGDYRIGDYKTERLYAIADDGAKVPVSLVYNRKCFRKDANAPLLLYGYGSYGATMDPSFSSARLSLLDRGFVFAIAHIRGGQEMGRQWYEDGKMMKKMNTFTDFIACARHLVSEHYTTPEHLYAQGGSAGGLLMGAVANMAPDLWHGIIAQVPFVDVVNTMLDESIPLTTNEYDEWGNPNDPDAYSYMKSYAPYENVEAKSYPNMLVTTGLYDSQVQYFEPAKWVAKLRATKTDDNILFLRTEMDFGHGGASGRFDYLKEIALEYAFLCALEGITV